MTWLTEELQKDCNYNENEDGSVDALIDYKNTLEDLINRIDAMATRNARGAGHSSAADVCGALFSMGFGNVTRAEMPDE